MAFNPEYESYSDQDGCAVICSSCICDLQEMKYFLLRLQYKWKQIANMGRTASILLSFAKCYSDKCHSFYSLGCKGSVKTVPNRFCVRI